MQPIIHEISSDDESAWDEFVDDPPDLFSELFGSVTTEDEDSDDVVVLDGDSCVSMIRKQNCPDSNATKGGSGNASDDDCLVLDADPDNPVKVADGAANGSDDLLIVGEKGQLACRDYPHPRHLCANFPFSTTPHEKYCDLCHCYVCDLRAPCICWGNGVTVTDHCNSTDKEEVWRHLRKLSKQGTAPAPTISTGAISDNMQPKHPFSESITLTLIPRQTSVSRSIQVHACSATSFGTVGNDGPNLGSRFTHTRNRHTQNQPVPRMRSSYRERTDVRTLGPQFISSRSKFKRDRSSGSAFRVNQSEQGLYDSNQIYAASHTRGQSTQATAGDDTQLRRWQDFLPTNNSGLSTFQNNCNPNSNCSFTGFQSVASQPQAFNQSIPQLDVNQNVHQFVNPTLDGTDSHQLELNYSWQSDVSTQLESATPPNALQFEPSAVVQEQDLHLGSALGLLEFHDENWICDTLEHQASVQENTMDPVLSDLDFLPLQPSTADPSIPFYESESLWGA